MLLQRGTPLWLAARAILFDRGEEFFRREEKVFKAFDAEDIHDLRVASRRLRESLYLFEPCYHQRELRKVSSRIKRVTRLLGAIRNLDETSAFFSQVSREVGEDVVLELQCLLGWFDGQRKKELDNFKPRLKEMITPSFRSRYFSFVSSPYLFSRQTTSVDLFGTIEVFAATSLDARLPAILRLVPEASSESNVEVQHLLRIGIKHLRYRMEVLSFLLGERFEEWHSSIKSYQDVLGKMHDLDVFQEMIRKNYIFRGVHSTLSSRIAEKRHHYFVDFSLLLQTKPLEALCNNIRTAL